MDFFVEQTIHAAPEAVAAIMFDPDRDGEWMEWGGQAEHLTPGPLRVGSRLRHKAGVIGWPVSFVVEVKAYDPGRRLEMDVAAGSDHGVLIFQVAPTAGGAIASIRARDDAIARMPHTLLARKQQAQDNLAKLATAVSRAQSRAAAQA